MATYVVPKGGAHVGIGDQFGERIDLDIPEGSFTPKSEQEEAALEHLVALGLVKAKG